MEGYQCYIVPREQIHPRHSEEPSLSIEGRNKNEFSFVRKNGGFSVPILLESNRSNELFLQVVKFALNMTVTTCSVDQEVAARNGSRNTTISENPNKTART